MANIKDSKAPIKFKLTVSHKKFRQELLAGLSEFVGRKNTEVVRQQLADKAEEIFIKYSKPSIIASFKNAKK